MKGSTRAMLVAVAFFICAIMADINDIEYLWITSFVCSQVWLAGSWILHKLEKLATSKKGQDDG